MSYNYSLSASPEVAHTMAGLLTRLAPSCVQGAERLLVTAAALGYVEVCRVVLAINHTATRVRTFGSLPSQSCA
jgi:hypothetical protein